MGGGWRVADAFKKAAGNTLKEIVAALLLKIVHNRTISGENSSRAATKKKAALYPVDPKITRPPPPAPLDPGLVLLSVFIIVNSVSITVIVNTTFPLFYITITVIVNTTFPLVH